MIAIELDQPVNHSTINYSFVCFLPQLLYEPPNFFLEV